jgi:SAM-dependent methyltransferase
MSQYNRNIYDLKYLSSKDKYFYNQFKNPYNSTIALFDFLKKKNIINLSFLDLGCGTGSHLFLLRNKYKNNKKLLGIDYNKYLINFAKKKIKKTNDINFSHGNIFNLNNKLNNKFDVALSIQTLSWVKDYKLAIDNMIKLNCKYIVVSSLFFRGLVDFSIKANFLKNKFSKKYLYFKYYNIYSLNNYLEYLKSKGYKSIVKEFVIKKTLPASNQLLMKTYTLNLKGKLFQFSGPIRLDWFFIVSKKISKTI